MSKEGQEGALEYLICSWRLLSFRFFSFFWVFLLSLASFFRVVSDVESAALELNCRCGEDFLQFLAALRAFRRRGVVDVLDDLKHG